MQHLHERLRDEARSILFDRTGSGWSGAARKPVTISGEVKQLRDLLECAKEQGPFILVGHSFGGLFSANFAHHYPELVEGVILLDSTPPWNVAYVGKLSFSPVLRKAWLGALASHFGMQFLVEPEISDPDSALSRQLHQVRDLVNALSVQPKSLLAEASVFKSCMDNPLDLVIGKGALGDVPLLLMSASPTVEEQEQLRAEIKKMLGLTEFQADNLMHGLRDSADQQVSLSSRGRQLSMPSGATHMFPYEYPDLVLEEVRKMQASVAETCTGSVVRGRAG
jgi:pimeloyl-ACP methyl ester carboxylesterase